MEAPDSGQITSRPFHIMDRISDSDVLVGTGAEISIIPIVPSRQLHTASNKLSFRAADETINKTCGERSLVLDIGLWWRLTWIFTVVQVKQPILGAHFLSALYMLVDIDEKLVDKNTRQQMSGTINTECEIDCVRVAKPKNKVFTDVLSKYECITRVDYQNESDLHHVRHHITTTDSPICAKSRGLTPLKLKIAKKEFEHMMHHSTV